MDIPRDSAPSRRSARSPLLRQDEKGILSGEEHFCGLIGTGVVGGVLAALGFPFMFFPDLSPLAGIAILILAAFFLGHGLGIPIFVGLARIGPKGTVARLRRKNDVDGLLSLLAHEDDRLREGAATVLGKMGDPRAVEPLIKVLSDKKGNVQDAAALALGKIGDLRAVEPLLSALKENGVRYLGFSQVCAKEFLTALSMLGGPSVVEGLAAALGPDNEGRNIYPAVCRKDIIEVLGKIGGYKAIEPLIVLLKEDSEVIREHAVQALRRITAENMESDSSKWRDWWERNKYKFEGPS